MLEEILRLVEALRRLLLVLGTDEVVVPKDALDSTGTAQVAKYLLSCGGQSVNGHEIAAFEV